MDCRMFFYKTIKDKKLKKQQWEINSDLAEMRTEITKYHANPNSDPTRLLEIFKPTIDWYINLRDNENNFNDIRYISFIQLLDFRIKEAVGEIDVDSYDVFCNIHDHMDTVYEFAQFIKDRFLFVVSQFSKIYSSTDSKLLILVTQRLKQDLARTLILHYKRYLFQYEWPIEPEPEDKDMDLILSVEQSFYSLTKWEQYLLFYVSEYSIPHVSKHTKLHLPSLNTRMKEIWNKVQQAY